MALLEEHRNTIYNHSVTVVGKEAAQAMLSQFPARDVEEPVTKEFFAAELHREMRELGDRLTNRMLTIAVLIVSATGIMLAALA
jgi:hypothetical protein